jgi:hypothetical protein
MEKHSIMFAAGPLYARGSDVPEAGMFILRANSFEETEAPVNKDPLHKSDLRTFTLQSRRHRFARKRLNAVAIRDLRVQKVQRTVRCGDQAPNVSTQNLITNPAQSAPSIMGAILKRRCCILLI